MENTEYEPYGLEWEKQMSKLPKLILIGMIKSANLKKKETEEWLLKTTQNIGHPAYNISSSTTIGIDSLREAAFDYLGIPKDHEL
jgi:hypothetical protein